LTTLRNLLNEESVYLKNLTKLLIEQTYKSVYENRSYDIYDHKYGYD